MAEPWMSVQAPQSWPTGNDQFSTLHLTLPLNNVSSSLPFTNTSPSIQWSQTWDVPQSQKNFAGSSSMTKTPMKVKNQVIEAIAVGLSKMTIPDPEIQKNLEILPTEQEEDQTPKGISAKKKKVAPSSTTTVTTTAVVVEEQEPNIEDELQKQNLYKTELCRSFTETGICRYGHKCQFAHGGHELRPVLRHPKYKTESCKTFSITGQCPYGNRCRFIHQQQVPPSSSQQQQQQQSQQSQPIPISSSVSQSQEQTWSTSWTNAGTSPSVSPSTAFAPQSSASPTRANPSASITASPSPGSSPASQSSSSSRDDTPRRLAFFQGLAN